MNIAFLEHLIPRQLNIIKLTKKFGKTLIILID